MTAILRKSGVILLRSVSAILLVLLLLIFVSSVSPIYDFEEPRPFSGPDIFNPYRAVAADSVVTWKRANFHTHTRVKGILNECEYWPDETDAAYRKLGYDIVTFSNHNELTFHPYDPALQVNVYEHGINLFKYHKLVFGCPKVHLFDHLIPLFASQKQFQLDLLGRDADFIQMNHPLRTNGTSKPHMERLGGYRIMELDSGKSTENEYWDWALSAGHYSFGLANDDLHHPERSSSIGVRCNFLHTPSARYNDLKATLLGGGYYAMRVPDYGAGDWAVKYARNRQLPAVKRIGAEGDTLYVVLTHTADSIKFTGQDHTTLAIVRDTAAGRYIMRPDDPYARITAYFPEGEVIYSNPFARYDASAADTPYREPQHRINWPLTVLFNLAVLALCIATIAALRKIIIRWTTR